MYWLGRHLIEALSCDFCHAHQHDHNWMPRASCYFKVPNNHIKDGVRDARCDPSSDGEDCPPPLKSKPCQSCNICRVHIWCFYYITTSTRVFYAIMFTVVSDVTLRLALET
ncbi:dimethylaniline monooxygenase [n-oxide-forming] [Plakobranchus ocellatus]|uniref:Dimethylaniline monooxygenase [n-oxide-forming] n=1 Tax=Plakobranchus ocellatus TaxID=259542 RepID=A0AAV3XVY7_9GAST|nr:dimethylaniline monooxygenase [n-oxide-forming] [Plakobranchus ocellatus]